MPDLLRSSRKAPSAQPIVASFSKMGAGGLADVCFFVNNTGVDLRVLAITERHGAAETTAGTLTATILKAPSGTAIASGTALHSGTINLKGTADTNAAPTLSTTASDLIIADGSAIGVDVSAAGTEIANVCISVLLEPASV